MSDIENILKKVNQLSEEVQELKARLPQAEQAPATVTADSDLMGIAEQIRHYLDSLGIMEGEKYICHSVFNAEEKTAAVQVTWLGAIAEDDSLSTARYCMALGNEHRIKILKALAEGERTAALLAELVGIEGGPLYHHLKELAQAKFVQQRKRSCYQITQAGLDALLTVCALNRRNTWEHKGEIWQEGEI